MTTTTTDRLAAALAERYRIEQTLGAGGMATVYLAHDVRHDRDVAIKVLNAELAESLGRQRFVREIRMAAKLNGMPEFDRIVAKAARRVAEFSA